MNREETWCKVVNPPDDLRTKVEDHMRCIYGSLYAHQYSDGTFDSYTEEYMREHCYRDTDNGLFFWNEEQDHDKCKVYQVEAIQHGADIIICVTDIGLDSGENDRWFIQYCDLVPLHIFATAEEQLAEAIEDKGGKREIPSLAAIKQFDCKGLQWTMRFVSWDEKPGLAIMFDGKIKRYIEAE